MSEKNYYKTIYSLLSFFLQKKPGNWHNKYIKYCDRVSRLQTQILGFNAKEKTQRYYSHSRPENMSQHKILSHRGTVNYMYKIQIQRSTVTTSQQQVNKTQKTSKITDVSDYTELYGAPNSLSLETLLSISMSSLLWLCLMTLTPVTCPHLEQHNPE